MGPLDFSLQMSMPNFLKALLIVLWPVAGRSEGGETVRKQVDHQLGVIVILQDPA